MRSKLSLVILPILVTMVSIPLCAQQRPKQSWDNLNRLQAGQKIEVVQMDLKSLKGRFLGFSEEAISVRVKKDEVAVARADVLRVSLRGKPKRGVNALIGTGLGALLGAIVSAAVCAGGSSCGGEPGFVAGVGAIIGAGAGAGMGAAVPLIPSYSTIYRVKRIKRGKGR